MFRLGHDRPGRLTLPSPATTLRQAVSSETLFRVARMGPGNGGIHAARPLAKLAAVGLIGALALTGCGSSDDSKDGGGLSGGGGGDDSGATYTIAFEGPLSGDNQQLGINEVNGVELAIEEANKDDSLGFKLKLIKADDGGVPEKAPGAAAQVLQDSTVMGVVGPSFSGTSQAVGKKYGDANLAIVNPSASNGELQDQGFKTWHRIMPNDFAEGPAAADWLAKKAKKVIVVSDKTAYGDGVAGAVSERAQGQGRPRSSTRLPTRSPPRTTARSRRR